MKFKLNIIFALFFYHILLPTGYRAQEKAFPKKGEGVTPVPQTPQPYRRRISETVHRAEQNKLGKGNALRMGVKYTLPPLQGKEAAAAASNGRTMNRCSAKNWHPIKSDIVRTERSLFLPGQRGHGGPDPGAIGRIGKNRVARRRICLRHRAPPGARNLMMKGQSPYYHTRCQDGIRDDKYLKNSKRRDLHGQPGSPSTRFAG